MKTHIAAIALCLTALGGVAQAQTPRRLPPSVTADTATDFVTVQNDRKVPVVVYLDWGEFDRRLGTVPAHQTARLPLPAWAVKGRDSVQVFVHPEGEVEDLASQTVALRPPGRLGVVVPPEGGFPAPIDTMMAVIPPDEVADATLTVDNPRGVPVTVFVEQGDFDVRLGQVPAHARATLRFPKSVVFPDETVQIFVHPEGGLDLASESLQVRRGEHLGLRVPVR
jgi:hypothetical protein